MGVDSTGGVVVDEMTRISSTRSAAGHWDNLVLLCPTRPPLAPPKRQRARREGEQLRKAAPASAGLGTAGFPSMRAVRTSIPRSRD